MEDEVERLVLSDLQAIIVHVAMSGYVYCHNIMYSYVSLMFMLLVSLC